MGGDMATRRYHEPRQRGRSPLEIGDAIPGIGMDALYVIGTFIVIFFALNVVDFGRLD